VFPAGTFIFRHSTGTGWQRLNPETCLLTVRLTGTYKIFGGTGKYSEIRGRGIDYMRILAIAARSGGKCTTTTAARRLPCDHQGIPVCEPVTP
jgi:hypothetical protein